VTEQPEVHPPSLLVSRCPDKAFVPEEMLLDVVWGTAEHPWT
jgi:hypothetical protein